MFDEATGSESDGKKKEEKKVKQLQPPPLDSPSSCDSIGSGRSGNETLMTAQIAWRLLMQKYRFKSITRCYCLPGVNFYKDKGRYKEGRDYFKSLRELRGHLCAYGIPDDYEDMRYAVTSSEMESLERWIRLSVVDAITENMLRLPEQDGIVLNQWDEVYQLLQNRLGYKCTSGKYMLPGVREPKESLVGKSVFMTKMDFQIHLARFGLKVEAGSLLSKKERLMLELYIASCTLLSAL